MSFQRVTYLLYIHPILNLGDIDEIYCSIQPFIERLRKL